MNLNLGSLGGIISLGFRFHKVKERKIFIIGPKSTKDVWIIMTNNNKKELNLLFLDLETNHLKPLLGHIIEVAAIYTDCDLNPIGKPFNSLCLPENVPGLKKSKFQILREPMNDFVLQMHTDNGLLNELEFLSECIDADALYTEKKVEHRMLSWLNELIPEDASFPEIRLAGHSINSLDLPFLRYRMPELYGLLSHRTLDISSYVRFFTDVCHVPNEDIPFGLKIAGHRAMDDCVMALEETKKFRDWNIMAFQAMKTFGLNKYVTKQE
jgi:oligoribonuclease